MPAGIARLNPFDRPVIRPAYSRAIRALRFDPARFDPAQFDLTRFDPNDMDPAQFTHVSLCAGYGGIDLGLQRVLPGLRTIAYSEIEEYACGLLAARMESGHLDPAPIWSDLKTFPFRDFHGCVDILSGGYPCQPFSAAGKRRGTDDPRHLWPFIADGIRLCQPSICFFENVEGHISLGLRDVLGDLGRLGYQATWGIFSASEVGAPHQRKRVFILAHSCGFGISRSRNGLGEASFQRQGRANPSPDRQLPDQWMADANDGGGQQNRVSRQFWTEGTQQSSCHSRTSESGTTKQIWPTYPNEQQCDWEPSRTIQTTKQREVEPALGGDADGPAGRLDYADLSIACHNRTDELRLLGNGVVPATAALAFRTLLTQLDHDLR